MEITVKFLLPDEKYDFHNFNQANKMNEFIWEFQDSLRSWLKYGHPFKDADDALDHIRDEWFKLKDNIGVVDNLE